MDETAAMERRWFVRAAKADPGLADIAASIARDIADRPAYPTIDHYDAALGLSALVLYALYRWVKNHFDRQRGLSDIELVRGQLSLVKDELVAEGVPYDEAVKVVTGMIRSVQAKALTDSVVQSAVQILSRSRSTPSGGDLSGLDTDPRVTPEDVLAQLTRLLPSQFEEVVFRARLPPEYLSSSTAPQATRALEMIRYCAAQRTLAELAQVIAQVIAGPDATAR